MLEIDEIRQVIEERLPHWPVRPIETVRPVSGERDGVFRVNSKSSLRPSSTGDTWRPEELAVDCPPAWARWNQRPNPLAPVHYGRRSGP